MPIALSKQAGGGAQVTFGAGPLDVVWKVFCYIDERRFDGNTPAKLPVIPPYFENYHSRCGQGRKHAGHLCPKRPRTRFAPAFLRRPGIRHSGQRRRHPGASPGVAIQRNHHHPTSYTSYTIDFPGYRGPKFRRFHGKQEQSFTNWPVLAGSYPLRTLVFRSSRII